MIYLKNKKYLIIYFLIAGLALSYSTLSYIREKNEMLSKISNYEKTFRKAKVQSAAAETVINVPDAKPETAEEPIMETYAKASDKVAEATPQNTVDTGFALPVGGLAITPFSGDRLVFYETTKDFRTHNGLDFKADDGEDVFAVSEGTVTDVSDNSILGKTVTIDHGNGLETVYSCLAETCVNTGESVLKGDILGTCGAPVGAEASLGTHLHFEVKRDGVKINPEELFIK